MNDTQTEQRKHTRKRLDCTALVFDSNTGEELGKLFDISREGFMLLTTRELTSQQLDLTMELPSIASEHRKIKLSAKCVWCQPSSFGDDFGAGFQVKSISEQDNVAWQYFIRDF